MPVFVRASKRAKAYVRRNLQVSKNSWKITRTRSDEGTQTIRMSTDGYRINSPIRGHGQGKLFAVEYPTGGYATYLKSLNAAKLHIDWHRNKTKR